MKRKGRGFFAAQGKDNRRGELLFIYMFFDKKKITNQLKRNPLF
jgi:hypothetical protein